MAGDSPFHGTSKPAVGRPGRGEALGRSVGQGEGLDGDVGGGVDGDVGEIGGHHGDVGLVPEQRGGDHLVPCSPGSVDRRDRLGGVSQRTDLEEEVDDGKAHGG